MNTYIDIWLCQSSDLGTLRCYCTILFGYFHSGSETSTHLSDCVNEQYPGLRPIYVCNRNGWLHAVSEYNSTSVYGSLLWLSTEHRLRTARFRLLDILLFQKCCLNVYCSALTADLKVIHVHEILKIVDIPYQMSKLVLFLVTYLGLCSLALPVLANSSF